MLPVSNQGLGDNIGFPDVCNTPAPSGTVPITYPNDGTNSTALPFAATVLVSMVPGHNMTAKPALTNGDNAGVAHSSFMQSGGNNCGNPMVLMTGAPAETLVNPTQGNNYNCSTDAKLVPSLVNVLASFHTPVGASDLLDDPAPSLGLTLAGDAVVHARRGGLASRAGVRAGDRLLGLVGRLELGAPLELQVERHGHSLRCAAIVRPTPAAVTGTLTPDGSGVLIVRRCSVGAPAAARRALRQLQRAGARRVTLDLRGNPGGLLASATDLAGLFLPTGTLIVSTFSQRERRVYLTGGATPCRLPLTVRIDAGTASAAEVLAAALVDHGRATLEGGPSFGKVTARSLAADGHAFTLRTPCGAPLTALAPSEGSR